jgi:hypothetical protein
MTELQQILIFAWCVGVGVGFVAGGYYNWFESAGDEDVAVLFGILFWPFVLAVGALVLAVIAPIEFGKWMKKRNS